MENISQIIGKKIISVENTGSLSIDDNEGILLTLEDGSKILFSWVSFYGSNSVEYKIISS